MRTPASSDLQVLAAWAPELADTFVALSCDIALVIDEKGRIARMAQHDAHPIAPAAWIGTEWRQTVGADSLAKVDQMLADVAAQGHAKRRELNHPSAIGGPVPVAYSLARLGANGPMLAIGHDLRAQAALQQRFLAAQEALERSYWNMRNPAPPEAPATLTAGEKASLGLPSGADAGPDELADEDLLRALRRLYDRIGQDQLPGLIRDARRLAERHFLARAQQRARGGPAPSKTKGRGRRSPPRR
jgi:hypothetical protein